MSELDVLYQKVIEILKDYRTKCETKPRDHKTAYGRETKRFYDGKVLNTLVGFIKTAGCRWFWKTGGCFMCSYNVGRGHEKYTVEEQLKQLKYLENNFDLSKYQFIYLYASSNFDPVLVPEETRKAAYNLLKKYRNLKYIALQSRTEFIDEKMLSEFSEKLKDRDVIIEMGLESSNDFISKYCVHKGFNFKDVKEKAELIKKYKLVPGVFILLKPPFLTEKEAIDDAVKSIKDSIKIGIESIELMCNQITKCSITELLHKMGKYRPLWLWSVIEVLENLTPEDHKKIHVSGFDITAPIENPPYNCQKCSKKVIEKIRLFKTTRDISVFDDLDCECKKQWKKELQKEYLPLEDRIVKDYKDLIEFYKTL